jgi:PAS domain S-box-containing protein
MKLTDVSNSKSDSDAILIERLTAENAELHRVNQEVFSYIREKTNQILNTFGTKSLRPEELEDCSLIDLDPIGIVTESFRQVLENLRTTNGRLQLAHQEMQAVFEAVGSAVLVLDPQMRIIAYNERVRELLLNVDEDATGGFCQEMVCCSREPVKNCVHRKVLATGQAEATTNFEVNGRVFDVIGQPIHDSRGKVNQIVLAYNEVTEHKRNQSDLKAALDDVSRSKMQIDTLLRSMSDGLVATDKNRRIVMMNQAAEELLGICLHDSLGVPFPDLVQHLGLFEHLEAVARGDDHVLNDVEFIASDGSVRTYQARTSALPGFPTSEQGRITLFHDVTREREIERVKDEFLSTAAHQLRTPLTTVIGYSDLLIQSEEFDDDARLEYLTLINTKAEQLAEIVSNLLDISRIEAGEGVALDCQSHFVAQIFEEALDDVRQETSGYRFKLDMNEMNPQMFADRFAVQQVLGNLLSNAMKYSPKGGEIVVAVRPNNGMCDISVRDDGIGMTTEQAEQAFDKFYRADASNTAISGTGLGLTIVQLLVEAHGGKVWIESQVGAGTTVHCTFPCSETLQKGRPEKLTD